MGLGKSNGKDDGGSVFVLLCILVLIVGIVAAAGMVMAVLNYTRESAAPISINVGDSGYGDTNQGSGSDDEGPGNGYEQSLYGGNVGSSNLHYDSRIWSIRVRSYGNRLAYFDRKTRQIRGYLVDLINAVCQLAGKNCAMVYDNSANCWGNDYPQIGLMGKWYDACSAYSITHNRVRAYKFSEPFTQAGRPVFLTLPGNPGGFDINNLAGAKIGFITGWWADRFCILGLLDFDLEDEQVFDYDDQEDLLEALQDGVVDVIYISNELAPATDGSLQVIRELEPCLLGGDSLMMRKDSLMDTWWDDAFERVRRSRTYREICTDVDDPAVHGSQEGKPGAELCVEY